MFGIPKSTERRTFKSRRSRLPILATILRLFFFCSPPATAGTRLLGCSFGTPSSVVGEIPGEAGVGGGGAGATKLGGVITPSIRGEPTSTASICLPFFLSSFGRKLGSSSSVYLTMLSCSLGSEVRAAARSTWLTPLESFFSWHSTLRLQGILDPLKLYWSVRCQVEQRSPWGDG